MMMRIILFFVLVIQFIYSHPQPSSLKEWLINQINTNQVNPEPLAYVIHLEDVDAALPTFKSKRNIKRSIQTEEESFIAQIIKQFNEPVRHKRTPNNDTTNRFLRSTSNSINAPVSGPKDLHLKANLKYHHQQRHPNGSISGSYAEMDPSGQLKVTHYVNDDRGFREYVEGEEPSFRLDPYQKSPSGSISVVTNSNSGTLPTDLTSQHTNNRRGINPLDGSNLNYVPQIASAYSVPPVDSLNGSPILHSAHNSVNQFSPKSPLFDKYYRPSPEEVQKSYDYHRVRSVFDPNQFRPTDMTSIPDVPRDKQPELRSVYSEYQIPYSTRRPEEVPPSFYSYSAPAEDRGHYNTAPYVPSLVPVSAGPPLHQSQDLYPRPAQTAQHPYPQTLNPQTPVYLQAYDGQAFIPGSTYSGPYLPNTSTFNQPYPTNIPIYDSPLPQNVPTFNQPPPENIPVYQQPAVATYGHGAVPVYYASPPNVPNK